MSDHRYTETKRVRGKNFSERDKQIALDIIHKFRPVLDNKATDGLWLRKKKETWLRVAEEYNAVPQIVPRDWKQLKILWGNHKRTAKKTPTGENHKAHYDCSAKIYDDVDVLDRVKVEVEDPVKDDEVKMEVEDHLISAEPPEEEHEPPASTSPSLEFTPTRKKRPTVIELKRILFMKKIQLANMEIRHKRRLYEIELEIKKKELERLN